MTIVSTTHTPSEQSDMQNTVQNASVPEGCVKIGSREMPYSPSNNSDNIISTEAATYAYKVQTYMVLILLLIGGPSNFINMAVFFKQGLRDRVNLLLFSLSVSDEVVLLMTMILCGDELNSLVTGERAGIPVLTFFANNNLVVFHGTAFVSLVLSSIIACERCYCVLRPLKYQTMMRTRTMACIIVTACVTILGLYYISILRYHYVCAFDLNTRRVTSMLIPSQFYMRHRDLVDYMGNIVFGAGVTIGVQIVVVTATTVTVWKLRQSVAWRSETSSSISSKELALTKMLVGTSILLIICLFPSILFRIARAFLPEVNIGRRNLNLYLVCLYTTGLFLMVNSSSNIFIYYVMGTRYRETFWTLFRRRTGQRKSNRQSK